MPNDDDVRGAIFRGGPFPVPSSDKSEGERFIEEAPARKEAALMREQGETAEDYRQVATRRGFKTTKRPVGRSAYR